MLGAQRDQCGFAGLRFIVTAYKSTIGLTGEQRKPSSPVNYHLWISRTPALLDTTTVEVMVGAVGLTILLEVVGQFRLGERVMYSLL